MSFNKCVFQKHRTSVFISSSNWLLQVTKALAQLLLHAGPGYQGCNPHFVFHMGTIGIWEVVSVLGKVCTSPIEWRSWLLHTWLQHYTPWALCSMLSLVFGISHPCWLHSWLVTFGRALFKHCSTPLPLLPCKFLSRCFFPHRWCSFHAFLLIIIVYLLIPSIYIMPYIYVAIFSPLCTMWSSIV